MSDSATSDEVPRIIYVGDVPIRALSAGPAVLFRLFEGFPPDRLLVAEEMRGGRRFPGEALPGVRLVSYQLVNERLLRTRWGNLFGTFFFLRAGIPARGLARKVASFKACAVVGIAHGYGWWTGSELARRLRVPFHLVVHDDWAGTMQVLRSFRRHAENRFGWCYRTAATRLVVSPAMESSYRQLYGSAGTVFYPIRSRRLLHPARSALVRKIGGPFTFAFAGDAGSPWAQRMLAAFANDIGALGARLRIHYSIDRALLVRSGLRTDNVEIVPFQPEAAQLQKSIVAGADATYLPMSFASENERNVSLCFPSKITDYTATGLPLFIHAPEYSSAACWARQKPGVACLVTSENATEVRRAVSELITNGEYRRTLAVTGVEKGWDEFDYTRLSNAFLSLVCPPSIATTP
jgi:hypothetical protein